MLFIGYPAITYANNYGLNSGLALALGVNGSGQVPEMSYGNWGIIDKDTPDDAYTTKDLRNGKDWQLVFSDEFNIDGKPHP